MKLKAIIVRCDSPTGNKEDYVYSDNGFLREIQILQDGKVVHKSGGNHPESAFETVFKGFLFYTPSYGNDVFVKVNDSIDFM